MTIAGVVRRKWAVLPIVAVLIVGAVGFVVLTSLNNPASGRLQHDDTLRTTTVEKQWRVDQKRLDACFVIRYQGKVSGNARSTWGITGPTTVWENIRIHDTTVNVEARKLHADGRCEGRTQMRSVILTQQWKAEDGDWRGRRRNHSRFGRGAGASSHVPYAAVRLEGDSLDRGASYRATVGVYVEPTWQIRSGVSVSDGFTVEDTVELPAG